ncbi:MAG: hypothetical protein D084_Lepto4C00170G0001 [Leptospirillum sp. Group IV 'UBA BS']|nr:MAG: hypothetical protein D084_Lepto4C00170G0001 [Leptospirillum sp. Group IV 'UBA BS']
MLVFTAFLLSLSSCGMGGGGTSGSSLPSTTFSAPSGATATSFGKIAVDKSNNNVWIATNAGLMEIPAKTTSCSPASNCPTLSLGFTPAGIAVDGSGNVWVTNDSSSGSVTEISSSAISSGSCSSSCTNFSGFSNPTGIAVDGSGNVWVTNDSSSSGSVTEIPKGTSSTSCSSSCTKFSGSTYFSSPTGIAVDSNNNVWVTNDSSTGSVTEIKSGSSSCTKFSGFSSPVAVATYSGSVWVANSGSGGSYPPSIVAVSSSCSSSCPFIKGFTTPTGLAFDSGGNLWVIDSGNNTLVEITSAAIGSTSCTTSTPCYNYSLPAKPQAIATDSNGNVWVTVTGAQVIEYTP